MEEFLEALEGDGPGGESRRNPAWDIGYYVDALGTVRSVATFNVSSRGDPCLRTWSAQCSYKCGQSYDSDSGRPVWSGGT